MRTTISVDSEVLRLARARAHAERKTLGELIQDAVQRYLTADPDKAEAVPTPVFTRGTGVVDGVDVDSNRGLYQALGGE
ncbi:MAG: antitoxin [Actinomycetota bacterium]|nr:antitoxin [Actinomycetota bacterium]